MENIIGREDEKALLTKIAQSGDPELVAVYGRRRVGKTFLILNAFEKKLAFEFSGIHNETLDQQLENFTEAISNTTGSLPLAKPKSWIQAFNLLRDYLDPILRNKVKLYSWMNFHGSTLHVQAFCRLLKILECLGFPSAKYNNSYMRLCCFMDDTKSNQQQGWFT